MSKVVQAITLTLAHESARTGRPVPVTVPASRIAKVVPVEHNSRPFSRVTLRTPQEELVVQETPQEVAAMMNGGALPLPREFLTRAGVPHP